jgi:hypothetical protein
VRHALAVVVLVAGIAMPPSPAGLTWRAGAPCDVVVAATDDIGSAVSDAPPGARVCLAANAVYRVSSPLRPRTGQTIVGPAALVGEGLSDAQDVVELKTGPGVGSVDVTLIDLDISGGGRNGVGCWIGTTVEGGRIHDNPKDGIGCDLEGNAGDVVVDGVEIDHNGSVESLGWGAAGIKWFHADGVTVRNSSIHDNIGNGVWCDGNCGDLDVVDNVITGNTRKGVFYEKSGGSHIRGVSYTGFATIRGNVIQRNNLEGSETAHAGISIIASRNVLVVGNTFGDNADQAIHIRNDDARLHDDKPGFVVGNVTAGANDLNGERIVGCDLPGVTCSAT